jgi:hypothetical protein
MGCTIAFSSCNKHFKSLGLPSRQVKSHEGLPKIIPTNIMQIMLSKRVKYHQNYDSHSLASLKG